MQITAYRGQQHKLTSLEQLTAKRKSKTLPTQPPIQKGGQSKLLWLEKRYRVMLVKTVFAFQALIRHHITVAHA